MFHPRDLRMKKCDISEIKYKKQRHPEFSQQI